MRLIVDTNVLVRYLVWDDEAQATASAEVIEAADEMIIPAIVLCEVVWFLKRAYRYRPEEIASTLRTIIESRNVTADRPAAETGLAMLLRGADFADGVIAFDLERHGATRLGATRLATFDRGFAGLVDPGKVILLGA